MDTPSNDDNGSESENPDELADQLSGPAIGSFPFEDVEEAETRASISASTGEADEGERSRRETAHVQEAGEGETSRRELVQVEEAHEGETSGRGTAQVGEAGEGETSRREFVQVEEANERETSRGGTAQVEEADEGETSSEDDEQGEADRDESDAELSDVEERKYCDFSSRENIEMNLELKCVTSEKMKKLYRNTERVSKILLCKLI